jgi:CRISPR-associated protein Cas1
MLGELVTRDTTIIISEFGSAVRKKGSRFVISRCDEVVEEIAASRIERIILPAHGASISTDAIALALEKDVPVFFSHPNGRPLAYLTPAKGNGGAKVRRAQYSASYKTIACLVKGFVTGKIHNQLTLLRKKVRDRRGNLGTNAEGYTLAIDSLTRIIDEINSLANDDVTLVNSVMVREAHAASKYWTSLGIMIPARFKFPGRKTRGASDPVNMLLNYGYAILRNEVWSAVTYAGLDPFGGFLHADKSSRPSLVLDLMEEFRAPVVDSIVMRLVCQRNIPPSRIAEEKRLTQWAKVQVMQMIAECLSSPVYYQGKSVRMHVVISRQAELVARALRNQDTHYTPFLRRW